MPQLQQVAAARPQFARTDRLDEEVDDARVERGLADGFVADHRHQHDGDVAVRRRAAETTCELEAVHAGHAVIEQQQVGTVLLAPAERIPRVAEVMDHQFRPDVLEDVAQHRSRRSLIVNDDDVHFVCSHWSRHPCMALR